jgi:hypothetical protein
MHSVISVQPVSASSGHNAHYHSATLRLFHSVGTTKLHGATPQNFNTDRRTRTKSLRNPRTQRRKCRVRMGDVVREEHGLYCGTRETQKLGHTGMYSWRTTKRSPKNYRAYVPKRFRPRKKASKSAIMHLGQDTPASITRTTQLWRSINIRI